MEDLDCDLLAKKRAVPVVQNHNRDGVVPESGGALGWLHLCPSLDEVALGRSPLQDALLLNLNDGIGERQFPH